MGGEEEQRSERFIHKESPNVRIVRLYLARQGLPQDLQQGYEPILKFVKALKSESAFDYLRRFLNKFLNSDHGLTVEQAAFLTKEHAHAVSKDFSLSLNVRTEEALRILRTVVRGGALPPLEYEKPDAFQQDAFGVAGGIFKRKWEQTGQIEDLNASLKCYEAGCCGGIRLDQGYTAINLAFLHDMREAAGYGESKGTEIRRLIVRILEPMENKHRWLLLTLAEAELGLGDYDKALEWTREATKMAADPWQAKTTAAQWIHLMELHRRNNQEGNGEELWAKQEAILAELLGKSQSNIESVLVGKVGLALSGGGFRASFFHLGLLARLAELDILRHVDVLSCVSGGSMVGAAYYIALRKRLEIMPDGTMTREEYCNLVNELIEDFVKGVSRNIRDKLNGFASMALLRFLWGHGLLSSRKAGRLLEKYFYRPIWQRKFTHDNALAESSSDPPRGPIQMHDLNFQPLDFTPHYESETFNPKKHNWLRRNNVPALVLNATTLNTGHSWQFTTTWMGEWPYDLIENVNSTSQIAQAWYNIDRKITVTLGQAVAASAAVPGVFKPSVIKKLYNDSAVEGVIKPFNVRLVDGGAYDNQGTVNLIAQDCNVILVSDAAGQLTIDNHSHSGWLKLLFAPFFIHRYATRMMYLLMERIRQASISALKARRNANLLKGFMFMHMKMGLNPPKLELCDYPEPDNDLTTPGTFTEESGIRVDFQKALSELRTDLNSFRKEEYDALMAAGYAMADRSVCRDLVKDGDPISMSKLVGDCNYRRLEWPFLEALNIMQSPDRNDQGRKWLNIIKKGRQISLWGKMVIVGSILSPILLVVIVTILLFVLLGIMDFADLLNPFLNRE